MPNKVEVKGNIKWIILKKLPDTECEIMWVVWLNKPPITTALVMAQLSQEKKWEAPTVILFMLRLVEKGFLMTEKIEKERTYFLFIQKEGYLIYEIENFMFQYHKNLLFRFVNTLYNDKKISEKDLDDLINIVKELKE